MHYWKTTGYKFLGSGVYILQSDQRSVEKVRMKYISFNYLFLFGIIFSVTCFNMLINLFKI
jgi:hypothetical protein